MTSFIDDLLFSSLNQSNWLYLTLQWWKCCGTSHVVDEVFIKYSFIWVLHFAVALKKWTCRNVKPPTEPGDLWLDHSVPMRPVIGRRGLSGRVRERTRLCLVNSLLSLKLFMLHRRSFYFCRNKRTFAKPRRVVISETIEVLCVVDEVLHFLT